MYSAQLASSTASTRSSTSTPTTQLYYHPPYVAKQNPFSFPTNHRNHRDSEGKKWDSARRRSTSWTIQLLRTSALLLLVVVNAIFQGPKSTISCHWRHRSMMILQLHTKLQRTNLTGEEAEEYHFQFFRLDCLLGKVPRKSLMKMTITTPECLLSFSFHRKGNRNHYEPELRNLLNDN